MLWRKCSSSLRDADEEKMQQYSKKRKLESLTTHFEDQWKILHEVLKEIQGSKVATYLIK